MREKYCWLFAANGVDIGETAQDKTGSDWTTAWISETLDSPLLPGPECSKIMHPGHQKTPNEKGYLSREYVMEDVFIT